MVDFNTFLIWFLFRKQIYESQFKMRQRCVYTRTITLKSTYNKLKESET